VTALAPGVQVLWVTVLRDVVQVRNGQNDVDHFCGRIAVHTALPKILAGVAFTATANSSAVGDTTFFAAVAGTLQNGLADLAPGGRLAAFAFWLDGHDQLPLGFSFACT
jgi:hypothetical protein